MRAANDDVTEYVCGFLFDESNRIVVLIRKAKPAWQRGKLNGVGGMVEPGESIGRAMAREFFEETGVLIAMSQWEQFAVLRVADAKIHFFTARAPVETVLRCRTVEDKGEEIDFYSARAIHAMPDVIPNLRVLIPLAQDETIARPVFLEEPRKAA